MRLGRCSEPKAGSDQVAPLEGSLTYTTFHYHSSTVFGAAFPPDRSTKTFETISARRPYQACRLRRHHRQSTVGRVQAHPQGICRPFLSGKTAVQQNGNGWPDIRQMVCRGTENQPGICRPMARARSLLRTPQGIIWQSVQEAGHRRLEPVQTLHRARPLPGPSGRAILVARRPASKQMKAVPISAGGSSPKTGLDQLTSFENRGYTELANGKES